MNLHIFFRRGHVEKGKVWCGTDVCFRVQTLQNETIMPTIIFIYDLSIVIISINNDNKYICVTTTVSWLVNLLFSVGCVHFQNNILLLGFAFLLVSNAEINKYNKNLNPTMEPPKSMEFFLQNIYFKLIITFY